ncbi:peptidoglycan-binding protein LysM [Parahaliea mediterranea]|uniref:Potassium binding protein Kbp n=1 Tax=Parahaliea mediterranea TaxID=651086 RepID=A0A939DCK9_9GAMM|nr:peptidoglycan-binding protein LysM [Parahaliea mediterranea]MBN7795733.1 peptidoglycan-binding protein LysM [Parahaliea mediterranea]
MGLFDFVAEAGEKLTEKVLGSTNDANINRPVEISPERVNQLRQENIGRMLAQLDIEGEQVTVTVNGALATLTGTAPSQEALEKMVLCAGNQHGISQVDCQLQVDAPEGGSGEAAEAGASTFYTVQPGDTLSGIAQQHYGSAGKYMAIFEANQPLLTDPNKIYPGQSLRIPRLPA